ncbi:MULTISPECIES: membrane protein insertase YidC [Snodgrassella]|uniref:Membrane protein insertase YidC n=1 Tax=Snodgrassella alvi TaxID=1196083 RepID=A0A2N9XT18_9NEIS|nr:MULTISPECIES: membrane protein insertase YidC [Snodgrassella]MCO6519443.1 membrane protein insertase YidC [Snodgrassella sp.]MCO6525905.1 membrane protein insertase YidC [Snodgrassella sp.]PIT52028.1 membrane protein insertase YidC [Snodgrassella communis]SCB95392.1 YidC/Oxa1 family membrane protein insertase [Snodgrassella sp. R-53583]
MDFKRLLIFFVLTMAILIGWEKLYPQPENQPATQQTSATSNATSANVAADGALSKTEPITVSTDTVKAIIDEKSGDLRQLTLNKYKATSDANKPFVLLDNGTNGHQYIAQSVLLNRQGDYQFKNLTFTAAQKQYTLNGDKLDVRLTAAEQDGVQVSKVYTFTKGSYLIGLRYEITNHNAQPLQMDVAYRVLRDDKEPEGSGYFDHTYTGPVLYTPNGKFEKVAFKDLDSDYASGRDRADYERKTNTGWIGMTQHYFMTTWILQPKGGSSVCGSSDCQIDIRKRSDGLYSTGVRVPLKDIGANSTGSFGISLYAGPQIYSVITKVADHLQMIKDYGKVSLFSSPLFWLLNWWHGLVQNWGWAIILLTLTVKAILFPLTHASYKSMAKMRAVAPRLQALKDQYGDDRMRMQQEMMSLYKKEKINPVGGCLPMLLQIPVFIGLYWALFASVELRGAPWLGWITDLGRQDPYFILPVLMALTMYLQTFMNPPPTDPMQAKMMKIMPVAFSVMFFFFPAGLVLYWLTNNILTLAQQWFVNKRIERQAKLHRSLDA